MKHLAVLIKVLVTVLAVASLILAQETPNKKAIRSKSLQEESDASGRLKEIKRELEKNPRSAYWHNQSGLIYARMNNVEDARNEFLRAIELDSCSPFYRLSYGMFLRRIKDLAGSEANLRSALALDPRNPSVRFSLADLLEEEGQPSSAREEYEKALLALQDAPMGRLEKSYFDPRGDFYEIEGLQSKILDRLGRIKMKKD
jgi:Tfp pilus assembly protein PilF